MKVVAYLTHPLGPKDMDPTARADNVANAIEWVRWVIENTGWSINACWLTHIIAIDDELFKPRVMVDQMAQMVRCDALILVGGVFSPHMRVEHQFAEKRGLPIVDLTRLGRRPPARGALPPMPYRNWTDWFHSLSTRPVAPFTPT